MFSRALRTSSQRGFMKTAVTWVLVGAFVSASTVAQVAGYERSFGALSITSDPAGATVYVDGEVVGQTPLTVDQLPAGDHRVKIVKAGYLENGRVVTVASGQSKNVNVKLTAGTSSGSASVAPPQGGSIFSNKWFLIGAAAAIGTGVYLATKSSNEAPTAGTATASRPIALQGASVTFTATGASDPDGDTLTYAWVFGDGGTANGASASHVYTTTGNFTAVVTVSDGKKSATSSVAVTVRNLTGQWRGPILGSATFPTTVNLTQTGTTITGTYTDSLTNLNGTLSAGSVSPDGTVTFTVTVPGFTPFTFSGPIDAAVNVINGRANGSGFVNASWVLTRS
jgi:hypothetical protein